MSDPRDLVDRRRRGGKRSKRTGSRPKPKNESLLLYVAGAVLWCLPVGLFFSLWVTLLYLVGGQKPFREVGVSYGQAVVLYPAGAVLVGILLGLLRPWVRGNWSAAAFGFVAGCAVFSMVSLARGPYDPLLVVLCGGTLGPAVAWRFWNLG